MFTETIQVGPQILADGVESSMRGGRSGELVIQELHGRFFEQVMRGNVYSIGCQLTALASTTVTLTASTQPILGVWNPASSSVNLAILQAMLTEQVNATTTVALGAFVWASSVGNTANMSAGLAPFNRKTLASTGSQAKAFSLGPTASLLTGLVNNVVVFEAADFTVSTALATTTTAAAAIIPGVVGVQNFDGGLIVPPGGVLVLLNTVSVTTHSVAGRLMWEEVPI